MRNITLAVMLVGTFSIADSQFNEQHKMNKSYIKTMAISKSKKGDKGSAYIKIKSKKELKKIIEDGKLKSDTKGNRYIVIDIKNAHLNRRDLRGMQEVNIGSDVKEDGNVMQTINIKNVRLNTDKEINIGIDTTANRRGSITTITNITNSQLGR